RDWAGTRTCLIVACRESGCGFGSFGFERFGGYCLDATVGGFQGLGPVVCTHIGALGAYDAHIGDAKEAKYGFQVSFLMLHGTAGFAGGIDAPAAECGNDGFSSSQSYYTGLGVLESATGLGQAIYPRFKLGRYG